MDNIILMEEQAMWWTMTMLKKSIKHMQNKNTEGQYDIAIIKEQNILRSFFEQALKKPEAEVTEIAA
jgi:hypothetical protein